MEYTKQCSFLERRSNKIFHMHTFANKMVIALVVVLLRYAAVAVEQRDGVLVERTELKGLDIVRRDWCELAKKCGQ